MPRVPPRRRLWQCERCGHCHQTPVKAGMAMHRIRTPLLAWLRTSGHGRSARPAGGAGHPVGDPAGCRPLANPDRHHARALTPSAPEGTPTQARSPWAGRRGESSPAKRRLATPGQPSRSSPSRSGLSSSPSPGWAPSPGSDPQPPTPPRHGRRHPRSVLSDTRPRPARQGGRRYARLTSIATALFVAISLHIPCSPTRARPGGARGVTPPGGRSGPSSERRFPRDRRGSILLAGLGTAGCEAGQRIRQRHGRGARQRARRGGQRAGLSRTVVRSAPRAAAPR